MRLDKVDLNLFVLFDALYRERSVTRVARLLNLTQPAVSNALARLRQTFDDPLFVRSAEGMSPTPVADNIVADVRRALELMRRSVEGSGVFDPGQSQQVFRLGMNDLTEALVLPALYKKMRHQAPGISITSYYQSRESATEELKAGRLDLLLDAPEVNTRELQHTALASFPYVLAMRKRHPLLKQGMTLQSYLAADHLHVSSRRKGRGHVDIALNRLGEQRRIAMRVHNYLVAARITGATDLLWSVPRVLAEALPLDFVELPFAVEPLMWSLYWSRSADRDPANCWMRELLRDVVQRTVCAP